MATSKEIANEILNQLSGYNRLNTMIGLKDCMINGNGLSFKIKNSCAVANFVKIELNSLDLYDVEIGKIRGLNYKVVKNLSGVYSDNLKGIIENNCKIKLSL